MLEEFLEEVPKRAPRKGIPDMDRRGIGRKAKCEGSTGLTRVMFEKV